MDDIYLLAKAVRLQQASLRLILDLTGRPHSSPGLRMAIDCTLDKVDDVLKRVDAP